MEAEVTLKKKYTNWNVYRNGVKKNLITLVPMTPEQAMKHFKADAVEGLEEDYIDHFGQYVNSVEAQVG